MARRGTSLNNKSDFGLGREIGSKYDSVKIVADNIDDIVAISDGISSFPDIVANIASIIPVGNSISDVVTVSNNISAVTAVYLNEVNINAVAASVSDVSTTAASISDVEIVARDLEGTALFAVDLGSITDPVETANIDNDSYIREVATRMDDITVLATEVLPNIAEILEADDNAAIAIQKAIEADASADAASTSETNASVSEANALTSATNADVSASNALSSENKANQWAEENEDVEVEVGQYSAKHWANKSESSAVTSAGSEATALAYANDASASATSAGNSATTATTQAGIATTKASEASTSASEASNSAGVSALNATSASNSASSASTSASNASTSESNASTSEANALASANAAALSETNAGVSESNALTYKNEAEDARDAAQTAQVAVETIYDTFDDRFLGAKVSDPTVDNDGNALLDGAMYFDTTTNALKIYDQGNTQWVTIPQLYLSGLLDVALTSLTTGDVLKWDGVNWVNASLQSEISSNADVVANSAARHTHTNKTILDNTTASFTTEKESKLAGIEDNATADQTGAEIKALYEAELDTNAFTDQYKSDVDSNTADRHTHTNKVNIDTIDQNMASTDSVIFAGVDVGGGAMTWNSDDVSLDIPLNAHVTLQTGQEQVNLVRNGTGTTITNGTVVMATGTLGASGRVVVGPHDGTLGNAMRIVGIATEDIASGADGFVTSYGKIRGLDTTVWNEGDILYVTPNDTGSLTNVEPADTETNMPVAFVISSANNGTIMTRVTGFDMNHYKAWVQDKLDIISTSLNNHVVDTTNPHSVTKDQVGLGNVDNTSDANKPVSIAQQTALDLKANVADVYNKSEVDALKLETEGNALAFSIALG